MPDARTPIRSFDTAGAPALLLTAVEVGRYRSELEHLRRNRRRDLTERLRDARTFVASDAIEEIAQIQEDDAAMQARMAWLQDLLDGATVVADREADDVAALGRAVEVQYVHSGKVKTYLLAGSAASGGPHTVSARSPVGQALMGRATGDVVVVELPGGRIEELKLVSVTPAPPEAWAA